MGEKQLRFPRMPKPCKPTLRSEHVARRIAERIVKEVNLDDFYWSDAEIDDRVWDVQQEIMRSGNPSTVFCRLWRRQPPVSDSGERGAHPYGWEGIDSHCRVIAGDIAKEEVENAVSEWRARYA